MDLNSVFTFGQYKFLTLKEVYQGTLNPIPSLIRDYLDMILNNIHPHIPDEHFFQFVEKYKVSDEKIEVIGTLEAWPDKRGGFTFGPVGFGNMEEELQKIINYHFSDNWLGILMNIKMFNASKERPSVIGGDPDYIVWCLRNIGGLIICEETIQKLEKLKVTRLVGMEVMYVCPNTYEYRPIIKTEYFKFPNV